MSAFIQSSPLQLSLNSRLNGARIAHQSNQRHVGSLFGTRRRSIVIRSTISQAKTDPDVQIRDPSSEYSALTKAETAEQKFEVDSSESKADKSTAIADAILQDMSKRPEYYVNISGLFFGTMLALVVASAILGTLNHIPFVPDMLKIIGLGYTFWFLRKHLTLPGTREELLKEVDDLVSTIRGDVQVKDDKTKEEGISNLQQQS